MSLLSISSFTVVLLRKFEKLECELDTFALHFMTLSKSRVSPKITVTVNYTFTVKCRSEFNCFVFKKALDTPLLSCSASLHPPPPLSLLLASLILEQNKMQGWQQSKELIYLTANIFRLKN